MLRNFNTVKCTVLTELNGHESRTTFRDEGSHQLIRQLLPGHMLKVLEEASCRPAIE